MAAPDGRRDNIAALITRRRNAAGAGPLLTYYDLASGERTELSATTFATWVDKTANLLLDEDVGAGDDVALELLADHPGHWVSLVWCAAAWQVGATVVVGGDVDPAIRVIGPEGVATGAPSSPYDPVVACSLHPMGFGFADPLPSGVTDYVDVRSFPDTFLGVPYAGGAPAWRDAERSLTQAELVTAAASSDPDARVLRTLATTAPALPVALTAVVRPLLGAGSTVLVAGQPDRARTDAIAAAERAVQE